MRKYVAVALTSLMLSIVFAGAPGTDDVEESWMPWMAMLDEHGLSEGYAEFEDMYPPGAAVLLYGVVELAPDDSSHAVALDVLLAAAQLGAGLLFAFYSRSTRLALGFVCATALSCSALGYLDVLLAMPLLIALYATLDRRPTVAASAYVVACLIKWQPLVAMPFFAVIWLSCAWSRGWRHVIALFLMPTILIMIAMLAFWPATLLALESALENNHWSGNALNLAWLLQSLYGYDPGVYVVDDRWIWLLKVAFAATYLPLLVVAIGRHHRDPVATLVYAVAGFLAYFLVSSGVHENHLYVAMLMGFVLWSRASDFAPAAIIVAAYANLNLFLFYGLFGTPLFAPGPLFAVVTAGLSGAALLAFTVVYWRLVRGDFAPAGPQHPWAE